MAASTFVFEELFGGFPPRPYQERVRVALMARRNVVLRAPTGAGKTLAVVAPFLADRERIGVRRLIYCLPMRTLVQTIHAEIRKLAGDKLDVRVQTGEQPDDPLFEADITVCTYDQLLSGLLGGPYGLPTKLYNINCAAAAGCLVVFDEFHLMDVSLAFATATELMKRWGDLCVSVWMTATATSPLVDHLAVHLKATTLDLSGEEQSALFEGYGIKRTVCKVDRELDADAIWAERHRKVLVVVNTVRRAQELYLAVRAKFEVAGVSTESLCLFHSRFFSGDRTEKRKWILGHFGKGCVNPAICIATQVIEAGVDISADVLLTELCPINSLAQRAGRCGRWANETGEVRVFQVARALPYDSNESSRTWDLLAHGQSLDPASVAALVQEVHAASDKRVETAGAMRSVEDQLKMAVERSKESNASRLIRKSDADQYPVIVANDPSGRKGRDFEPLVVRGAALLKAIGEDATYWIYDPELEDLWKPGKGKRDLKGAFLIALPTEVAAYDSECGLRLGERGEIESPPRKLRSRIQMDPLQLESWNLHTRAVRDEAIRLWEQLGLERQLPDGDWHRVDAALRECAIWHDVGKLQKSWQRWAQEYMKRRSPEYNWDRPLAHTTWDWRREGDQDAEREARLVALRPPHAMASAVAWWRSGLSEFAEDDGIYAARLYAVLSHHGGGFGEWSMSDLVPEAAQELQGLGQQSLDEKFLGIGDKGNDFDKIKDYISENLRYHWPEMSLLSRLLRRADQTATKEGYRES